MLLPFVAVWGLAVNDQVVFLVLAAIDVALCWWAIGRLPVGFAVRLATTVFFAFGTVFWYTAQIATTWYQAHIVAVGLTFLAIGIAVGADPTSAEDERDATVDEGLWTRPRGGPPLAEPRGFLAGLLFGLASTARLTSSSGPRSSRSWARGPPGVGEPGPPVWVRRSRSSYLSRTTC